MGAFLLPGITIVSAPTRLEGLRRRWGTAGQAKFRLMRAHAQEQELRQGPPVHQKRGRATVAQKIAIPAAQQQADFLEYEQEDAIYKDVVDVLEDELSSACPSAASIARSSPTLTSA